MRVRFPHIAGRSGGQTGVVLDPDHCYRLLQTRDRRFDGWFVTAVRTTGIYCRPSCPAVMPKRANVEFFPTAAAAQQHGYRACKRCRPDASPGSPEWDVRGDVVALADAPRRRRRRRPRGRATASPAASATASATSTASMTDELGAGPLAIARAQRAHTARTLLETTDLALPPSPTPSGFGSLRQFNDTVREVFAADAVGAAPQPTRRGQPSRPAPSSWSCRCASRSPPTTCWRSSPPAPSPASSTGTVRRYTVPSPAAVATASSCSCTPASRRADPAPRRRPLAARRLARPGDGRAPRPPPPRPRRRSALRRRRARRRRGARAVSVTATPGLRVPGSVDPFETAVRAVIGQQISVAGARTVAGRIVAAVGDAADDRRRPRHPRVPVRRVRSPTSTRRCCRCRGSRQRTVRELGPPRRRRRARARRRRRSRRGRRDAVDVPGHRAVDGGLRADARTRRSRRVPADRPRRPGRPRRRSASSRRAPSAGGRSGPTACTTCGRSAGSHSSRSRPGRLNPMDTLPHGDRHADRPAHARRSVRTGCARCASRTAGPSAAADGPARPEHPVLAAGRRRARRVLRRHPPGVRRAARPARLAVPARRGAA